MPHPPLYIRPLTRNGHYIGICAACTTNTDELGLGELLRCHSASTDRREYMRLYPNYRLLRGRDLATQPLTIAKDSPIYAGDDDEEDWP